MQENYSSLLWGLIDELQVQTYHYYIIYFKAKWGNIKTV